MKAGYVGVGNKNFPDTSSEIGRRLKKIDQLSDSKGTGNSYRRSCLINRYDRTGRATRVEQQPRKKRMKQRIGGKKDRRKEGKEWTNCLHLKRSDQLVPDRQKLLACR